MMRKQLLFAGLAASSAYAASNHNQADEKNAEVEPQVNVRNIRCSLGILVYSEQNTMYQSVDCSYPSGSYFCIEELPEVKDWYRVVSVPLGEVTHEQPDKPLYVRRTDLLEKTSAGEFREVTTTKDIYDPSHMPDIDDPIPVPWIREGSRLSVNVCDLDFDAKDGLDSRMLTILRGTDPEGRPLQCNGQRVAKSDLTCCSDLVEATTYTDDAFPLDMHNGICQIVTLDNHNGRFHYYFVRCAGDVLVHWDKDGHFHNESDPKQHFENPMKFVKKCEAHVAKKNKKRGTRRNMESGLAKICEAQIDGNGNLTLTCEQTIQKEITTNIVGMAAMSKYFCDVRAAEAKERTFTVTRTVDETTEKNITFTSINVKDRKTGKVNKLSKYTVDLMVEQLEQLGIKVKKVKVKRSEKRRLLRASRA